MKATCISSGIKNHLKDFFNRFTEYSRLNDPALEVGLDGIQIGACN